MMSRTHSAFGMAAYTGLAAVGIPAPVGQFWLAGLWAILPDVDCKQSHIGQHAGALGWLFRKLTGAKHRGLTHRWWFWMAVMTGTAYWWPQHLWAVGVGYATHLIGDKIRKTGTWFERKVLWAILAAALPVEMVLFHVLDWRLW